MSGGQAGGLDRWTFHPQPFGAVRGLPGGLMCTQELMQDWAVQKVKFSGYLKQESNHLLLPRLTGFNHLAADYSDPILLFTLFLTGRVS